MNYSERLLTLIKSTHISEKSSVIAEKSNSVVLKVAKYATKTDIKDALCMLFSVKIKKINILITSKKRKGSKNRIGYRSNWKKVYIVLKDGYKLDLTNQIK